MSSKEDKTDNQKNAPAEEPNAEPASRRHLSWWVLLPIALYILLRLPPLTHATGGQDENLFCVPGYTVLKEGIPRIPYFPTRIRETFFENADVCMMSLPPGYFYVQAPFFAVLEPGYPAARAPSFVGAILAIVILFYASRRLGASNFSALLACVLLALSRPLLFTGITARPDMLSILFGWLAIICLWRLTADSGWKRVAASGALCGLAALFHPIALIFCIQTGVMVVWKTSGLRKKLLRTLILGASALVVLSLWLPLILMYPYEFSSQFVSNVLERAGPGLFHRLAWPFTPTDFHGTQRTTLGHQSIMFYEFAGIWQTIFSVVVMIAGSVILICKRPTRSTYGFLVLAWSSVYLTATVAGVHPTKGYWVYSFVWMLVLFALAVDCLIGRVPFQSGQRATQPRDDTHKQTPRYLRLWLMSGVVVVSIALMLPGTGLRTTYNQLTHWGDPAFHGKHFIESVLKDLPEDGVFMADRAYVFDVYLSGRETRLGANQQQFWGDEQFEYDYLLLEWENDGGNWPEQYDAVLQETIGTRQPPGSCFVEIYRPKDRP